MGDLLKLIWYAVAGMFRPRPALQTEVLALRHQLNVLRRRAPKRVAVSNIDRLVFAGLYHLAPEVLDAVKILKPETGAATRQRHSRNGALWNFPAITPLSAICTWKSGKRSPNQMIQRPCEATLILGLPRGRPTSCFVTARTRPGQERFPSS
jgi:hypothetical protein